MEMKYILTAVALVALCVPAFAQGLNPTAKMFVHVTDGATPVEPTDNATVVNTHTPAAYSTVRAYIGVTDCTGFSSLVFRLNDALVGYPGVVATQGFVNLLPGNLAIGNAFGNGLGDSGDGITLATACAEGPFVLAGYAEYFYLGGDFTVEILDHNNQINDWEGWIVDCQEPGQVDMWCVWLNGAIGAATPPAGDEGCEANVPVEDATWGAIKAIYR
jgi:hypothetical protein